MNDTLNQFLANAKTVSLTADESASARRAVHASVMAMNPLREGARAAVLTPGEKELGRSYIRSFMHTHRSTLSHSPTVMERFFTLFSHKTAALSMMIIIGVTGGGTLTYGAEDAVPGDLLYPIKTSITEPLRTHFFFGSQRKADWAMRRIERRMHEGQILMQRGRFSLENKERLEMFIAEHIQRLEQRLAELSSLQQSDEIREQLERMLEEHEALLSELRNGDADQETLDAFMETIHSHKGRMRMKREQMWEKHPDVFPGRGRMMRRPRPPESEMVQPLFNARPDTTPPTPTMLRGTRKSHQGQPPQALSVGLMTSNTY